MPHPLPDREPQGQDQDGPYPEALLDTGSEYTWVPAVILERIGTVREKKDLHFIMANGEMVTRSVGFAILRVARTFTIDEVVFAEPGARPLNNESLRCVPRFARP